MSRWWHQGNPFRVCVPREEELVRIPPRETRKGFAAPSEAYFFGGAGTGIGHARWVFAGGTTRDGHAKRESKKPWRGA